MIENKNQTAAESSVAVFVFALYPFTISVFLFLSGGELSAVVFCTISPTIHVCD